LDLADQVQRGLQGFSTFFPLGRAHFTGVSSDVLSSLHLAQQLGSHTADAVVVHFHHLDVAFGVDHEGTAQCDALFFDQHFEVAGQGVGGGTDHRLVDLADGGRRVVPCLVREVRVGGNSVDLDAQLLELCV